MNAQTNSNKGFTIIEVVLVLAIAALIFLMVFIALPALQRGQRDTARKNDATTISSALGTYRSNNNGKLPNTSTEYEEFVSQYIDGLSQYGVSVTDLEKKDPATGANKASTSDLTESKAYIVIGENCKGTDSARAASIYVKLESGNGAVVCTDA